MKEFSKHVALDTHKETIAVGLADTSGGPARFSGEIANTPEALAKLRGQLGVWLCGYAAQPDASCTPAR